MPTSPALKLAALMASDLPSPDAKDWERQMRSLITRGHLAAWMAGTGERLNVKPDSPLLSRQRLSRAEREEIKRVVERQLEYLRGFLKDKGGMSEAAIANRSELYSGAVKSTYYAARWGDWEIPDQLLPGNQECITRCKCAISVKDNGDGTGVLTRTMHAEAHCTTCPPLAGDHPVKRRGATKALGFIKHMRGAHDQRSHGRSTGRRSAFRSAYRQARAGGASLAEARAIARDTSELYRVQQRMANITHQMGGHMSEGQRRSHQAELERLQGRVNTITARNTIIGANAPSGPFNPTVQQRQRKEDVASKVRSTEDKIRTQRHESLYVYDKQGNALIERDGKHTSVDVYPKDRKLMKDAVITHNHPIGWEYAPGDPRHNGNSFSRSDIETATWGNAAEMRAVTPTRRYSIRRPEGGWPKNTLAVYDQENAKVRNLFTEQIRKGRMSIEEAEARHTHEVWLRVSERLKIPYDYTA